MKSKIIYALIILIISTVKGFSQDSIPSTLGPVLVIAFEEKSKTFLPEAKDATIYAGKKTDLIVLGALNADLSVNSSRQIFGKIPGVNIWESDGSGIQTSIATRGLSPNRSWEYNVRQNGYDIAADPLGYPEAYYSPPTEAVSRIEFIRGASSISYGPQFGGSLNYILKTGTRTKALEVEARQTVGSFGLQNTFVGIGGSKNKWTYYTFFHKRNADGWRENARYSTLTGHLNVSFRSTENWTIGLEVTTMDYSSQQPGGLTDEQFKSNWRQSNRERNWMGTPWNVAAITSNYRFKNGDYLDVKIFGMMSERNSVGFTSAITTADSAHFARQVDSDEYVNFGTEIRYKKLFDLFDRSHVFTTGVRLFEGSTSRNQRGQGTADDDFDMTITNPKWGRSLEFQSRNGAAFVELLLKVSEKILVTPGVRYEYIESAGSGYIGASSGDIMVDDFRSRNVLLYGLGAEYKLTRNSSFYSNITKSFRPVMFSDITPSATTDAVDPDLSDASGHSFDLGYRGFFGRLINFDASVYWMEYDNRIGRVTENGIVHVRNIGTSISKGAEVFISCNPFLNSLSGRGWGNLEFYVSSSINQSKYTRWNNPAADSNPALDIVGNKVEYAPEQIHRVGATYKHEGFSITWQVNSMDDVYTDANNTELPTANAQSGKLDGYVLHDVSAMYKVQEKYTFSLGINNVFDTHYATRRSGGYPGPGLLPGQARSFFATVGVKI